MSVSVCVTGIVEPSERHTKMCEIHKMCNELDINLPEEVEKYFNGYEPNPEGLEKELPKEAVEIEFEHFVYKKIIDLTKIPKEITKLIVSLC